MAEQLRFGSCRLDVEKRELLCEGQAKHLSPKAFDLLVLLVHQRPRVVTKAQLLEAVWKETFVSEVNLPVLVGEIRRALGGSAKASALLKTHHGVGYSFTDDVQEVHRRPTLRHEGPRAVLVVSGRRIELPVGTTVIGRDEQVDVVIAHASVSRRHARLSVERRRVVLEDLNSKNGTRVDGVRIAAPAEIHPGAVISFGSIEATLQVEGTQQASTLTLDR